MVKEVSLTAVQAGRKPLTWQGRVGLLGYQLVMVALILVGGSIALVGFLSFITLRGFGRIIARFCFAIADGIGYGIKRVFEKGLAMLIILGGVGYGGYYYLSTNEAAQQNWQKWKVRSEFEVSRWLRNLNLPALPSTDGITKAVGDATSIDMSNAGKNLHNLATMVGAAALPEALQPLVPVLSDPAQLEKIAKMIQSGKIDANNLDALVPTLEQNLKAPDASLSTASLESLKKIDSPMARSAIRRFEKYQQELLRGLEKSGISTDLNTLQKQLEKQ